MFASLAPEGFNAASAGVFAAKGRPASIGSRNAAARFGLSLNEHNSQPISDNLVAECERVYCLTLHHAEMLRSDYPSYSEKILTLSDSDISDPFGLNDDEYFRCAEQIYDAIKQIIREL
jgi:protein-tyrosine phosphatase